MSAGNSFLWETCGPNVFRGEYHDSFPIDLMCKDTQLGYEMARNAKVMWWRRMSCFFLVFFLTNSEMEMMHFRFPWKCSDWCNRSTTAPSTASVLMWDATLPQNFMRMNWTNHFRWVKEENLFEMIYQIYNFPIILKANGFENWSYTVENVDGALHVRHKGIELEKKWYKHYY